MNQKECQKATDAYAKVEEIVHGRIKERCFGIKPKVAEDVEPEPAPRRGVLARLFRRKKGA